MQAVHGGGSARSTCAVNGLTDSASYEDARDERLFSRLAAHPTAASWLGLSGRHLILHFPMKTQTALAVLVLAMLSACAGTKEPAKDSTAAMAPAAAMTSAAAMTPANYAGTWQMMTTVAGTAKPVAGTLVGSADGKTFTVSLEGRPNIAQTASMSGDSLVIVSAEYESVLRKGVMVTTRTAAVMNGEAFSGNMTAMYKTPKGEEKVLGTVTGTRTAK